MPTRAALRQCVSVVAVWGKVADDGAVPPKMSFAMRHARQVRASLCDVAKAANILEYAQRGMRAAILFTRAQRQDADAISRRNIDDATIRYHERNCLMLMLTALRDGDITQRTRGERSLWRRFTPARQAPVEQKSLRHAMRII